MSVDYVGQAGEAAEWETLGKPLGGFKDRPTERQSFSGVVRTSSSLAICIEQAIFLNQVKHGETS